MDLPLDKLAPRAIAAAVVGYCIWPSLIALQTQLTAKPVEKPPASVAGLLKPALAPPPERNPFQRNPAAMATRMNQEKSAGAAAKSADPLQGLTLDATCIIGRQRLAIINGRLYAPQDKLRVGDSSASPYKLVNVFPYKVLLEREGKSAELTYSNVAARPDSSRRAAESAGAKGDGTSNKTKK